MSSRYVRNEPDSRENLSAAVISGALAACVGLATFYLARLLLAREPIGAPGLEKPAKEAQTEK